MVGFVPVDGTADVGESVGAVHTINPVVWPIIPHYCNMLATRDLLLHAYSQQEPNPTNNPDRKSIIHHKRGVISLKQASKSLIVTIKTFLPITKYRNGKSLEFFTREQRTRKIDYELTKRTGEDITGQEWI